jgi:DNA polymerase I-like protein with 3'-5' exonuclease and polymerase domains
MKPKIDIKAHIAKLRAEQEANPQVADDAILFWGTFEDKAYLPQLKSCVGSVTTYVRVEAITMVSQIQIYCKAKKVTRVISTSVSLLEKLLHWDKRKKPALSSYAGSYFTLPSLDTDTGAPDIEIVFIAPLKQLSTVSYGKFIATRLISKLTNPEKWYKPTPFNGFEILTASNEQEEFAAFSQCQLISIDIETFRENATIRCLSYTGFCIEGAGGIRSITVVLPLNSDYSLAIMRKWNWELKAPKVFQNGKYDISYLARYNAPVYNYLYDTATLFHCWYSELPKDLGFLNAFFIREAVYWKDLSETNDLYEYYKYNGLDTWGTGNAFLAMLLEAPQYALDNYLLEFPLTFPCHMCEMTGIARDMSKMEIARTEQQAIIDKENGSLNKMLGIPAGHNFNVKSSLNMKALFNILGCKDLKSQDEKNIKKARFRHPFNSRILTKVLDVRKARTLISNYLTEGKEFTRMDGTGHRFLYSLNPHGTDSSRLASKSHHFWCGDNIQKIPRGKIVKQTFKADPGFMLCEVDLEQAESRDTAYISGDAQLIENVEHSPDFHKSNASGFFGVPFDEVTKELRTLGKPVNHGANYNMGAYVLIDTMGEENIVRAKQLLGLPRFWSYVQVAEHLLEQFHKLYPGIKGTFYKGVVREIGLTSMLVSTAFHWDWTASDRIKELEEIANKKYELEDNAGNRKPAWARYCFADPSKSKPALNSYISHPPQSLNAQTLNKGFLSVFHDIAINPKYSPNFKLLAQIHDSIFFQYRIGHEYLSDMVVDRMEIPVTVKAYDGEVRTFVVPAGAKMGQHLEGDKKGKAEYWSETE